MSDPVETPQSDPHLAALVQDITGLTTPKEAVVEKRLEEAAAAQAEEQTPATPEEAPKEQATETPPAEAEKKPDDPAPEEPKVEVKKPTKDRVKELVASALREIQAKTRQEQPPKPEEKKPEPKPDELAHLSPEDREELELVRLGADDPKFQTLAKKLEAFHAADKAKRQALLQADPERTLDENDQEYADWSAKRPRLATNDAIRLSRKASESQLDKKLDQRLAKERREIEEKVVASEARPILAQRAEQFGKLVFETVADKPTEEMAPLVEAIKSGADLVEADPLFGEIVQRELAEAQTLGTSFIAVTTRAEKFNPSNAAHAALAEFVNGQDEYFKAHGGDARVINGRSFMTRREFAAEYAKDPTVIDRAWTTSDDQVLRSIAYRAKMMAETKVKAQSERLSKAGFQRQKNAQDANPPKPPQKEVPKTPQPEVKNPPAVRATASPGPGAKAGGVEVPRVFSDSEMGLLVKL